MPATNPSPLASELLFVGGHVAHIAQYYEHHRLKRIMETQRALYARKFR
jgi:hypothetical protein